MSISQLQNARKEILITPGQQVNLSSLSMVKEDVEQRGKLLRQITLNFCLKRELTTQEIEWLHQLQTRCLEQEIQFRLLQVSPRILKELLKVSVEFIEAIHTDS